MIKVQLFKRGTSSDIVVEAIKKYHKEYPYAGYMTRTHIVPYDKGIQVIYDRLDSCD